ncbi:TPX2-LIKE PROTEIN 3 [Hibiscus trionum]|uniref:TPX2-LIKE PROTEIN 3 n=1 Tax=Hibiscus trionum TaxID=183268 RepID=A0A9W7ILL4_HIBTR|nr:TPX2-LIKE PROTEIN 3 [Hibiscus trionum]
MEEQFYSIEQSIEVGQCFDIDYEFDAPQCYDFSCIETDWEAKEAELWFESAGSYPPSPFVIKLKWRCDLNEDGEFSQGSTECDEYNGETCNRCCEGNLGDKSDSRVKASLSRSSTLMKPTASYLAKQNQSRRVLSNHLQKSLQKSADKFNKSPSLNGNDASKRQKLETGYLCKVAHLKHHSQFVHKKPKTVQSLDGNQTKPKVTIPREPELQTARRAQRHRSKESDGNAKSNVHLFKALPLNKKILESPSFPIPKKSQPQPPEFQVFHLRTSERAKQHAYNNAMRVAMYVSTSRNENTCLRSFKSINSFKEGKYESVNKSNKKVTSCKVANAVLKNMNQTTATSTLSDEPPVELLNKLSLSSELHSGENSEDKMAISEALKENEPGTLLLQRQIMEVVKEHLQRSRRMQYQCRSEKIIGIGRQDNISRSLRLEVV